MIQDGNVDITKGKINLADIARGIFNQSSNKKHLILVERAPGVGKSTFTKELCLRWSEGNIAKDYELVLLLRLRDNNISQAQTLEDLICCRKKGVPEAVCKELESCHIKTMFILEGLDELPNSVRNGPSIFNKLISGELLPHATILVTCRPWAAETIHNKYADCMYQHVKIMGFSSHQISEYIQSTISTKEVPELNAYLERHPQIRAGMYIPLNSAIVVRLYQEMKEEECDMPRTITELYTGLVRAVLVRYLRDHPECETKYITM